METQLPDWGGIEALIAIRAESPAARIMVLTTCDGDVDVQRALKAGASGYLLKTRLPASYCRKSEEYIQTHPSLGFGEMAESGRDRIDEAKGDQD
jgi:DNA-binding NarL/FixJ family response regulator